MPLTAHPDVRASRRSMRGTKAHKHYQHNVLTQAGPLSSVSLTELLTDLRHAAVKNGIPFETCMEQSLAKYSKDVD